MYRPLMHGRRILKERFSIKNPKHNNDKMTTNSKRKRNNSGSNSSSSDIDNLTILKDTPTFLTATVASTPKKPLRSPLLLVSRDERRKLRSFSMSSIQSITDGDDNQTKTTSSTSPRTAQQILNHSFESHPVRRNHQGTGSVRQKCDDDDDDRDDEREVDLGGDLEWDLLHQESLGRLRDIGGR